MIDIVPVNTFNSSAYRGVINAESGALNINVSKDPITNSVGTMPYLTKLCHDGRLFHASCETSIGNGVTFESAITNTGVNPLYIKLGVETDGKVYFYLFENTTFVATGISGASVLPVNFNRYYSDVSNVSVKSGSVLNVLAQGTLLDSGVFNGNEPVKNLGGVSEETEWVFRTGVNYLFRITNQAGTSKDVGLHLQWYEG